MPFRPTFWPTAVHDPGADPAARPRHLAGAAPVSRKRRMIAERTARTTAAPIALPAPGAPRLQRWRRLEFRRAAATGDFLHEQRVLSRRPHHGRQCRLSDRDAAAPADRAATLLVNRGWVPEAQQGPGQARRGAGRGHRHGRRRHPRCRAVRTGCSPTTSRSTTSGSGSICRRWPPHAGIAAAELVPVFLEAGPAPNPGGIPIGGQTKVDLPNDHLQYAITWYILAVALAVIYVALSPQVGGRRQNHDGRRDRLMASQLSAESILESLPDWFGIPEFERALCCRGGSFADVRRPAGWPGCRLHHHRDDQSSCRRNPC